MDSSDQTLLSARDFLEKDLSSLLKGLEEGAKPAWGIMTPQHMVEHLIVIYKLSIGRIKVPISSKEEDWPKFKAYLMKDSPMRRSVQLPDDNGKLQPLRAATLEEAKSKLLKETEHYLQFVVDQPDFVANHPFGGPMTAQEWLLFHRKHIKHHFIQFGLLPDYE